LSAAQCRDTRDLARLLAQLSGDPTDLVGDLAADDRAAEQDRLPDELTRRLAHGRRRPLQHLADVVREGISPTKLLEHGEGARVSETPEPRIYEGDELAQTLAAATEPWATPVGTPS
jgi:hypothetical protein